MGGSSDRPPDRAVVHHPGAQHRAQKLEDGLVADAFLDRVHQLLMWDRLKTVGDVRLDHPPSAPPGLVNEHLQGVVRCPPRPKPERAVEHVGFEDRLEHDLHRCLHNPVADRRDRQWTLLASARLRDEHPTCRADSPRPAPQVRGQFIQQPGHPVLLDVGDGLSVDACCAAVAAHVDPRPLKDVSAIDLVRERVEPSPGNGLGRPVKRMLQGTDRIRNGLLRGGTSHDGTHRATSKNEQYASTKQRPFPHRRFCCPLGSRSSLTSSTTTASDAHPTRHPLPGVNRL